MKYLVAKEWVEKLRSGEYTQGKSALAYINPETHTIEYCCLGVLCDMAKKAGVYLKTALSSGDQITFDGANYYPPAEVQQWAGMNTDRGFLNGVDDGRDNHLADANDRGKTFAEIADLIERNAEKL